MHNLFRVLVLVIVSVMSCQSSAGSAELTIDGVGSLIVQVEKFVPEKHNIKKCGDYNCLIDGIPFFGSDGKIPTEKIRAIKFSHKGGVTNLDVRGMYDPGINSGNVSVRIDAAHYWGSLYKITGRFSDGAGTYIAQWIVTKDGSIRTHISDMETMYDLIDKISGK